MKSTSHANRLENGLKCLIEGNYVKSEGRRDVGSVAELMTALLTLIPGLRIVLARKTRGVRGSRANILTISAREPRTPRIIRLIEN